MSWTATGLLALTAFAAATAQDSVSKNGCLPGDALYPFQTAASPLGSEQVNSYVVDLTPAFSSWGNAFAFGPIAKAGQSNAGFFTNFMGAQAMSRRFKKKVPFVNSSYALWVAQPGVGINNDPTRNDAPTSSVNTAGKKGLQFAAAFQESEVTVSTTDYQGVVTTVVNLDSEAPTRLYVKRIQSAVSACDEFSEQAAIGFGGVDADGNTIFRTDGFGATTFGCGLTAPTGNNVFLVDALTRNGSVLNVVSNDYPAGLFDTPSTKWIIRNDATAVNCPTLMPEQMTGTPVLLGTNFLASYVRGTDFGLTTTDTSHLPAGTPDHRGNLSYLSRNFALLGSTHGLGALLGQSTTTDRLIVFGLNSSANVTGTVAVILPAAVVDNSTGFANLGPGTNQFDHYHSQVAFQGGNGQVAMNIDSQGDLLVAAQVSHPTFGSATNGTNYIGVCRIDKTSGAQTWTMAGYNDGANGKPILDSAGGTPVAQMIPINKFSTLQGPSVSAPMIDSAGNVWFISAIEMFDGSGPATALLRAVYDRTAFKYDLELVAKTGDVYAGPNSGKNYRLASLRIADSNSVASDTAWSQNLVEEGFMGLDGSNFDTNDARTLGGMVVSAVLIYDVNGDQQYDPCDPSAPVPSPDESYRVLWYVGANSTTGIDAYGQGCPGTGGFVPSLEVDGFPKTGKMVTLSVSNGLSGQSAILFFGLLPASIPIGAGCNLLIQPLLPISISLPLFGPPGAGNGSIAAPVVVPSIPAGFTVTMQALCTDPSLFKGFCASNGVQLTFQ